MLEFIGDIILNAIVTQEMMKKFAKVDGHSTTAAFVTAPRPTSLSEDLSITCEQLETEGTTVDTKTVRSARSVRPLDEGDFTKIRNLFISKEYLSSQAVSLSLDRFILYGSNEKPSPSAREDMMEALIGAVAMDSDWDWSVIRNVTKRLLNLNKRLSLSSTTETATVSPDDGGDAELLLASVFKESYFDLFNNWHQKRWGCMPTYNVGLTGSYAHDGKYGDGKDDEEAENADSSQINTVNAGDEDNNDDAGKDGGEQDRDEEDRFYCDLTYFSLKHSTWSGSYEKKEESAWATGESKAKARETAAEIAYNDIKKAGLLERDIQRDSGIEPNLEDAVNQIQELKQKKYLKEFSYNYFSQASDHQSTQPTDEEIDGRDGKKADREWLCSCYCSQPFNSILGCGQDKSKRVAKKMAALDALKFLFNAGSKDIRSTYTQGTVSADKAAEIAETVAVNNINTQGRPDIIIEGAEKFVLMVHLKGDNVSNDIYRLFSVPDTASLDDVCGAILDSFDFDHDHLYTFSVRGETYLSKEADLDKPWTTWITLKELRLKGLLKAGDCMVLHYDFSDNWRFLIGVRDVTLETTTAPNREVDTTSETAAVETAVEAASSVADNARVTKMANNSVKKSRGSRKAENTENTKNTKKTKKAKQPLILLKSQGELQQYP